MADKNFYTINGKTLTQLAVDIAQNSMDSRESLSEFNQSIAMDASILFDAAVTRLDPEFQTNLAMTLQDRYICNYLMAVTRLTKIGDMTVEQILEPLSTRRGDKFTVSDSATSIRLSAYGEWNNPTGALLDYSAPEVTHEAGRFIESEMQKPANLAVGKMLIVPLFNDKGIQFPVPVACRLNPTALKTDYLVDLLQAFVGNDQSVIGRWHKYWANQISLWDYLTNVDITREERRLELQDEDGWYRNMKNNFRNNWISTLLSGNKGQNIASSMVVLTDDSAQRMEKAMRGEFRNMRTREKFFKATGSFMLAIIQPTLERVRIYERGIGDTGIYTFDQVKPASSGNGATADINAMMKAYRMQNQLSY